MLNNGLYKTYKYGGVGEAYWNAITQGSKKDGPFTVTGQSTTTEPTTMTFDPKYTTNAWTSQTQSTSSWGDCSMFALRDELRKNRKQYIDQNLNELKMEIARGEGEHLKVVVFYSACQKQAIAPISNYLRSHMPSYLGAGAIENISNDIDHLVKDELSNQGLCYQI